MTSTLNFQEIFDAVQSDPVAKKAFLAMTRDEQMLAILGMLTWSRSETAIIKKDVISIKSDMDTIKRGRGSEKVLSTSEKIQAELQKRFGFWTPILQQIVAVVFQAIVLYLLFSTFGGNP